MLDAGCGTGAITVGMARIVGPSGKAVGMDRDSGLLEIARQDHQGQANLGFVDGDLLSCTFRDVFDVVTAARALQWISDPGEAVVRMRAATKPGGLVVALDYDHADNAWTPEPPPEFRRFYDAFLAWRAANGWDNHMANHLPGLFAAAGLESIEVHDDDQVTQRDDADSETAAGIWLHVIRDIGPRIVQAGFAQDGDVRAADGTYSLWMRDAFERQELVMKTVVGVVPS